MLVSGRNGESREGISAGQAVSSGVSRFRRLEIGCVRVDHQASELIRGHDLGEAPGGTWVVDFDELGFGFHYSRDETG